MANKEPLAGLLPSTISQWLPENGPSAASEDQAITGGTVKSTSDNPALTSRLGEKDPLMAPEIPLGFTAEASSSVPEAMSSATADVVPKTTSGPTMPTKSEASPTSVPEIAPHPALEPSPSEDPRDVLESTPPAVTTSATHDAPFSTDPEKTSTSTVPALDGRGTPTSSSLEKEIDLEAGHGIEESDRKEPGTTKTEVDPNIVDWDGPDDPKNPINWPEKLKWANVAVIAAITFLT